MEVKKLHWYDEVNIAACYDKETFSENNKKNIPTTQQVKQLSMALRENLDDCLKQYSQLQNDPYIQKSYASL